MRDIIYNYYVCMDYNWKIIDCNVHVHVCKYTCTTEPSNKEHVWASNFVLCREVVLSLEVENVLVLWESEHLGPQEVSFIERWSSL